MRCVHINMDTTLFSHCPNGQLENKNNCSDTDFLEGVLSPLQTTTGIRDSENMSTSYPENLNDDNVIFNADLDFIMNYINDPNSNTFTPLPQDEQRTPNNLDQIQYETWDSDQLPPKERNNTLLQLKQEKLEMEETPEYNLQRIEQPQQNKKEQSIIDTPQTGTRKLSEQERLERRKASNRKAAKKFRNKKKDETKQIEEQLKNELIKNEKLAKENRDLKASLAQLRAAYENHICFQK
ncbi:DgyrCDS10312 [Dimorphilus gyrociliatus]|uniref:DgyrCDS10312 n=1 Tax=Dimorphilus gyrociliatus TaxID=2664684 RepID=A0A7I8W1U1_9ANNE|nr:DgyrCDS10312 [Dimorphilus gyrociliatus]